MRITTKLCTATELLHLCCRWALSVHALADKPVAHLDFI